MLRLAELQSAIRAALLGRGDGALAGEIARDGIAPEARLAIYRHHVFTTLTAVLADTYPVVCRLVDPRFFGYAADQYIRAHPPSSPRLDTYGERFPEFLASFPPCRDLACLPDVARLEWAITVARAADDAQPLDPTRLASVTAEQMPALAFRLEPSVSMVASDWPIDRIWRANQPDVSDPAVDLDAGPVQLEIRRCEGQPTWRALDLATYTLRRALLEGRVLADAGARALAVDPAFDLTAAFRDLLGEQLLTDFTVGAGAERSAI